MRIGAAILPCVALVGCASTTRIEGNVAARATAPVLARPSSFVPSQETLFIRLTGPTDRQSEYAKVVFEWLPPQPDAELPPELLAGVHTWEFSVLRDPGCDQAPKDIPDIPVVDQGASVISQVPGLRYLHEGSPRIPASSVLRCYRLKDKASVRITRPVAAQQ